jgi:uncharacterized glyoxalase superfamily protein PhnB
MSVPAEADGNLDWAMVSSGNVSFMFQTFQSLGDTLPMISRQDGGSLLFYIRIRKIRSFFDAIQGKVNLVHGLQKTFYGATEFSITDPNNYLLTFAEDEADKAALHTAIPLPALQLRCPDQFDKWNILLNISRNGSRPTTV